ncbi:MAG: hypothetical protein RI919_935 [Actinomycetota bacterium]
MSDLRLIGSEDGYVLFESLDGTKHRALADNALKSAMRKASAQDTSSYVSPREIQERIRNGDSVAQICEDTSSPEDYVSKFAKPVIDELEHMIESAKAVRLVVPGDRFNDEGQIEFGELISARLEQANAVDIVWSVKRSGATTWDVTVVYTIGTNSGLALWAFDPRKVLLTPENEAASGLSTVEGASGPITKVRVIADTPAAFRKVEASEPTIAKASLAEPVAAEPIATIESLDDLRKKREAAKAADVSVVEPAAEDLDETIVENDAPLETALEPELDDSPEVFFDDGLTASEDDSQEIAENAPEEHVEPEPEKQVEPDPEVLAEPRQEEPVEPVAERAQEPDAKHQDSSSEQQPAKKPRAAMPSWDQIVFGTKSED